MNLLDNVTEPQREGITHINGPLLVIAGAGSGKTKVITHRIGYLIEQGISPYNILALTFTNKAAKEMKERVSKFCKFSGMWISTFHSMCARILRTEIERLGYSSTFTIYDKQDQQSTIKGALKELEYDSATWKPAKVSNTISNAKNNLISAEKFTQDASGYYNKAVARVYSRYESELKRNNALDFDDLLLKVVELFVNFDDVLAHYQDKFQFIMIDEYQDTNRTQYKITSLLADKHLNICATGDPDQSIYSWRGADLRNILDFEKEYPDTKTIKLEQNFRSTKTILRAASDIIANNVYRKEKGLWTENCDGSKIKSFSTSDENQEAEAVEEQIRQLRNDKKRLYSDMAVFYRTNAQSRIIEDTLRKGNIPYLIIGAVEFYRRKEVKDILAYLKLCVNWNDNTALTRIINIPPRGIGKVTTEKITGLARTNNISILQSISRMTTHGTADAQHDNVLKGKSKLSIAKFAAIITALQSTLDQPVKNVVARAIELTRYKEFLKTSEGEKSADKIENIEELVSGAEEYDRENPDGSLAGFLENVSLVSDLDNLDEQANAVTLMTLHAAKGLEFPIVFFTGMEDGLLPHSQAKETMDGLEEERRLCYVGITRAKEELILTHAHSRFRNGQRISAIRSPFLDEIPHDIVEVIDKTAYTRRSRDHDNFFIESFTADEFDNDDSSDGDSSDDGFNIRSGDVVRHQTFGVGRVNAISGSGKMRKAQITFNTGGAKSLLLQYARLERV